MGFWGTYIVARAANPLTGLAALRPSVSNISWHGRGADGWQAVRVHRGPDGWASSDLPAAWEATLRALMEQAGHPVLAAVVLDSDGAQLIGYSPREGRWGGWLMLDRIIGHIDSGGWRYTYWDDNDEPYDEDDQTYLPRHRAVVNRLSTAAGPPGRAAAPAAVAWATAAGLKPEATAVASILDDRDVFCEDLFFTLLTALGVPDLASADA